MVFMSIASRFNRPLVGDELLRGNNVSSIDIDSSGSGSRYTVDLRFSWEETDGGARSFLHWRDHGFGVLITRHGVNALATDDAGEQHRFSRKANDLRDDGQHSLRLIVDAERDVFTVQVDGRTVIQQLGMDLSIPSGIAGSNLSSPMAHADANETTYPLPLLKEEGLVFLPFYTDRVVDGLVFEGDAHIDANGFLSLDGNRDAARLTEQYSLENADYLSARLWFRFDDPGELGYASLLWNHGSFGLRAKGNALNAMVMTDTGREHVYVGGMSFADLQWHYLTVNIDASLDTVTIKVDGEIVLERTDLDLVLPSTKYQTHIGGTPWGGAVAFRPD